MAAVGSVAAALQAVREAAPDLPVEVEVDSLEQLDEVLELKPTLVLLDNFRCGRRRWQSRAATPGRRRRNWRAQGGLTLDVAADYAKTGVDYLAVGALTHSGDGSGSRPGHVRRLREAPGLTVVILYYRR